MGVETQTQVLCQWVPLTWEPSLQPQFWSLCVYVYMCVEYAFTSVYVCVCTIMKARGVPCSIAFCLSPLRQDLSPELGWQPETPVLLLSLPPKTLWLQVHTQSCLGTYVGPGDLGSGQACRASTLTPEPSPRPLHPICITSAPLIP